MSETGGQDGLPLAKLKADVPHGGAAVAQGALPTATGKRRQPTKTVG